MQRTQQRQQRLVPVVLPQLAQLRAALAQQCLDERRRNGGG
jgi:hypothetical protein